MVPAGDDEWVDTYSDSYSDRYAEWYAYGAFHALGIAMSNKARRYSGDARAEDTDRVARKEAAMRARALAGNVLVLIHAALESWVNAAGARYGIAVQKSDLRGRWTGVLGAIAEKRGDPPRSPRREIGEFLDELDAARQVIVHGDTGARDRYTRKYGPFDPDHVLTVARAEWSIQGAEEAFRFGEEVAQTGAPTANWRPLLDTW